MSTKCKIKICYEDIPKQNILGKTIDLFSFNNYNEIKKIIFKHSENKAYDKYRLKEKDLFVLKFEEINIPEIDNRIWDDDSFRILCSYVKDNQIEKLKLIIKKVKKYPSQPTPPPKYDIFLQDALLSTWESTKKDIKEDLSENSLNDRKRVYLQEKKDNNIIIEDNFIKELNINIICNNCLYSNFSGARYICAECNNFNLCEYCQEKARLSHNKDHTFIRFNNPVVNNIEKYNCIISPNKMLLNKKYEPFEVGIDIMNNGEEALQECFLSPIRFGEKYFGCLKTTIIDECKNGEKIHLNVFMKFDDSNQKNLYEGYFRLMTKEGIPFGDILYIQVTIQE